jgi:hypothetical protein
MRNFELVVTLNYFLGAEAFLTNSATLEIAPFDRIRMLIRVHMSLQLDPFLSQLKLVHILTSLII